MNNVLLLLKKTKETVQRNFAEDYTLAGLRLIIIAWSIFVAILALLIDNKWALSAILAYEVLP